MTRPKTMTQTLVVTHAAGFLACFTAGPDGSMRQRALIDTGQEPPSPAELAELGSGLASTYGWHPDTTQAPSKPQRAIGRPPKALPAARAKKRKYPPIAERQPLMLSYLQQHGPSTVREFVEAQGYSWDPRTNATWWTVLESLVKEGLVTKSKAAHPAGGNRGLYTLVPS